MTPVQTATKLMGIRAGLAKIVRQELAETAREALAKAKEYSRGTASTQMLSTSVKAGGLGHPYGYGAHGALGIRGPIPNGGDAAIINKQTGDFYQRWRMFTSPNEAVVINDSPVGRFLVDGTKKMIARPIDQKVMSEVSTILHAEILTRIEDLFK